LRGCRRGALVGQHVPDGRARRVMAELEGSASTVRAGDVRANRGVEGDRQPIPAIDRYHRHR
jgi:hypothetical protein